MPHYWVPGAVSVIGALMQFLGGWREWVAVAFVLIGAYTILKWAWFSDNPHEEIYYPPLDRVLRAEEDRKPRLR